MEIILNNKTEVIDKELITIDELLAYKNYTFKMLVVKINDVLVKRDAYNSATVKDGDRVMIMHLVSGG